MWIARATVALVAVGSKRTHLRTRDIDRDRKRAHEHARKRGVVTCNIIHFSSIASCIKTRNQTVAPNRANDMTSCILCTQESVPARLGGARKLSITPITSCATIHDVNALDS